MASRSRVIVFAGIIAAMYVVLTIAIAPLSYGPVQFRVSEILKPLALFSPVFAFSFAIGTGMSNLFSPFGWYDWFLMPFVDCFAALVCFWLRKWPIVALGVQGVLIAIGVTLFPLGFGAQLPFVPTFLSVLVSELILLYVGYFVIWRKYGSNLLFRGE